MPSNQKPVISIVVPVYNREDLVVETITSVLNQSFPSWELILVDDHSKDRSWDIINASALQDTRIIALKNRVESKGASACRNMGWRGANADFIMFLDSDDLLAPWSLSERMNFIHKAEERDLYVFQAVEFSNSEYESQRLRAMHGNVDPLDAFLSFESCWQTSCVIWQKSALAKVNGWDESTALWQDGEVHVRALLYGCSMAWGCSLPDVFIRVHPDSIRISNSARNGKSLINLLRTYNRIADLINDPDRKQKFIKDYNNNVYSLLEILNKVEHVLFLDLYAKSNLVIEEPKLFFTYSHITLKLKGMPIALRLFFQLRKFGWPNRRKNFFTKNRSLSELQLRELISLNQLAGNPLNGVNFLEKSLTDDAIETLD